MLDHIQTITNQENDAYITLSLDLQLLKYYDLGDILIFPLFLFHN